MVSYLVMRQELFITLCSHLVVCNVESCDSPITTLKLMYNGDTKLTMSLRDLINPEQELLHNLWHRV
jgi:hypothetical protein